MLKSDKSCMLNTSFKYLNYVNLKIHFLKHTYEQIGHVHEPNCKRRKNLHGESECRWLGSVPSPSPSQKAATMARVVSPSKIKESVERQITQER